ncbi:MAG: right-handed parallel beta-helix repeat-containing protein [Planctomycetota bacterium]|jgi:parallel beta-helix repeat protein
MLNVRNSGVLRTIPLLIILFALSPEIGKAQSSKPVADAGLSRYAAQDPVVLDGTGSYDPDNSGLLSYTWRQIAGPSVVISDANTATPTISGFIQTDEIQECEFELIVSNSELTSLPDTVKVIIVPEFGADTLRLRNPPFDRNKPTLIYFGGGDCVTGSGSWGSAAWGEKANVINFPTYGPDPSVGGARTYYKYGDMIIVYLSAVAPYYKQPIQTIGWSTGGQPAIDVGIRLNLTYVDARYAVNRVTLLEATQACRSNYSESVATYLASSVDGEQCWIDSYISTPLGLQRNEYPGFHNSVLNVGFDKSTDSSINFWDRHALALNWYRQSLMGTDMKRFNNGVVTGAYWSVVGPGKNLQLASTPDVETYKFKWYGWISSGYMDFFDEPNHPGRLPEPVKLVDTTTDIAIVDANGAIFSCEVSKNAVGYKLLFGRDPYHMVYLFSDTPSPPAESVTTFPFEQCWWTVRANDEYGSTIHADPVHIKAESVIAQTIENAATGQTYASIQQAINDAHPGDEIVVSPGICQYLENINFKGKNLTVRSTNPNDPAVVAATILTGNGNNNLVTFSNSEDASCVLAGFTITNANNGIYCFGSSPTITNCSIVGNVSNGIKLYMGSNPTVSNCIIAANGGSAVAMFKFTAGRKKYFNSPTITNCTIVGNSNIGISEGIPSILNSIINGNGVQISSSSAVVTYSNVQGGFNGEGNIDADPLFADAATGDYHLKSQAGRWDPASQSWVIDDVTSPCIDTGDPNNPIGHEPFPNGGIINMGAYGGSAEASKSP